MDLRWRRSRRHSREWLNDRIGPIVASELESFGVQASIIPSGGTFFMKPLVRELVAALTKDGKAGAA